eukprot:c26259_g1_i1 orf=253-1398(-)
MDFTTLTDAFDRVSKKQKLSDSKTQDIIDTIAEEIEIAAKKLLSIGEGSGLDQKTIFTELQAKLNELGPSNQIGVSQKELNLALSKYGRVLDKLFCTDIAKGYKEVDFDTHIINQIIALHFYRQGLFDLGDCFVTEAQEPGASLRAPFFEMYQTLEHIKVRNLEPALTWAKSHREELLQKGSSLEFRLLQLKFVQLLHRGKRSDAIQFARGAFGPFATRHMGEIQRLMGCLLWADRIGSSPYSDLLSPTHWDVIAMDFTRECCSLLCQSYESPLCVTISAGSQALPTLLKMVTVLASKKQEWQTLKQLPVEIELGKEYQFHSIFACPISKDQSSAENPPMLMPCGHVLCKLSLQKLAKSRLFKCPYCPVELSINQCKQLYF